MKRTNNIKRTLWLWVVFLLLLNVQANAQQECGTQFHSQQEQNNWVLRHQQYMNSQVNSLMPSSTVNKWIPVQLHIVRNTNGTGGISLADARDALDRCNTAFSNTVIRFYECGYDYINVDTLYDFTSTEESALVSTRLVAAAANVFIVNSINIPGFGSACGYAQLPGSVISGYNNNFIIMAIGCMNSASQTSLQHEFGHFFDLLHAFDTSNGAELVTRGTGANCSTAGDGFCDTPADPNVWDDDSCLYKGTGTDTNGDIYTPDPSNIMTYSFKPCRVHWSQEQIDKMNFTVSDLGEADRKNLSCDNCLQASVTSLPENFGGTYPLEEYYTYGTYSAGKKVLSQITSDVNLNTAIVVGSDLKLIASTGITFLPGFDFDATTAQLGELSAIVDPCGGTGNIVNPGPGSKEEASAISLPGTNSFTVFPNPFKNSFTLKLNLEEDAQVSVTLYDLVGKMIDPIVQPQSRLKGLVQFDYSNDKLPPGMYVCVIEMNGKHYTEKMIKF